MTLHPIIAAIRKWQNPTAWSLSYDLAAELWSGRAPAVVEGPREVETRGPDGKPGKRLLALPVTQGELQEMLQAKQSELNSIVAYVREVAPGLVGLVPVDNFLFGQPSATFEELAGMMRKLEGELLAIEPKPSTTPEAPPSRKNRTNRTPAEYDDLLEELESEQRDDDDVTEESFAREKGFEHPSTLRAGLNKARARRAERAKKVSQARQARR